MFDDERLEDAQNTDLSAICELQAPGEKVSQPAKLFLEITTRCNLRCPMCVKQTDGAQINTGDMKTSTFKKLLPDVSRLKEVVISGVGEPLLHPMLDDFILDIKTNLPITATVGLQTNGTLLTRQRIEQLLSVDLDIICISLDAVDPLLLGALRKGAQMTQFESVLHHLKQIKRRLCSAPMVGLQFVMMQQNLHHLPRMIHWAVQRGVDFIIVSHLLPFDAAASRQVLYTLDSDASSDLFHHWRHKIARAGLRIEDYPDASVKYYKQRTAADNKLIEMMAEMKSEATRKAIDLHLPRLIAYEKNQWDRRVIDIYEEAQTLAQNAGLDLILPASRPTHIRRCSFIEEDSVFVNWQGLVSPCHFTWHGYACYPDGRKKFVQPLHFGNLASLSLTDIWQTPVYRSFRKQVLLYDFPYCGDCGLSPCDYIEGANFKHDCHTITVPCCDCLWPTGLFNCLQ